MSRRYETVCMIIGKIDMLHKMFSGGEENAVVHLALNGPVPLFFALGYVLPRSSIVQAWYYDMADEKYYPTRPIGRYRRGRREAPKVDVIVDVRRGRDVTGQVIAVCVKDVFKSLNTSAIEELSRVMIVPRRLAKARKKLVVEDFRDSYMTQSYVDATVEKVIGCVRNAEYNYLASVGIPAAIVFEVGGSIPLGVRISGFYHCSLSKCRYTICCLRMERLIEIMDEVVRFVQRLRS